MDNLTRIIKLQLQDTVLHASSTLAGYEGEHCATQLQLDIPTNLVSEAYTYQLSISAGGVTRRALLQHNKLVFDLPVAVMVTGNIFVSLIISDGTKIIRKSDVCNLTVSPSLDAMEEEVENRYIGLLEDSLAKFCNATEQLNAVTINTPYIGNNTNWYVYDAQEQRYVDTGICAKGDGGTGITDNSVATIHIQEHAVTEDKLAQGVVEKFVLYGDTPGEETSKNLYDPDQVLNRRYYASGTLVTNAYVDTMPLLSVTTGDKIYASSCHMQSKYSTSGGGIRVGLFFNGVWVQDLTPAETYQLDYIEIPAGVNQVAVPFWKDDTNRYLYITTTASVIPVQGTSAIQLALALKAEMDTLSALLHNDLQGKRVSILGDSISTFKGYIPDANRARYPQSNLLTDVNHTWWMRLINNNGMVLGTNDSWAGSLISWDGSEGADIGADKHIASSARIKNLDNNGQPDYIFVFGGTNDVTRQVALGTFNEDDPTTLTDAEIEDLPVNTYADAYRTMLIRLLKWYPQAHIICILPLYTSQTDGANLDNYNEITKTACDFFGVPIVDTRAAGITMFNRTLYLPDGIHPNAAGMRLICDCVERTL